MIFPQKTSSTRFLCQKADAEIINGKNIKNIFRDSFFCPRKISIIFYFLFIFSNPSAQPVNTPTDTEQK